MFRCMVVRSWHALLGGDMQFSGQVRGSRDTTRAWFGMLWHLQFGQCFLAFTLRHPCAHVAHPLPVIGTGHFRQVFDVIWRNIHAFALLLHVHAHAAFRMLVSRRRVCTHACAGTASARQTCASSFSASYKACTCVACKHKRTRKRARAHAVCTLSAHTWPANLRHEESLDLLQLADTQYLPLPAPDAFRTQHKPRQDGYHRAEARGLRSRGVHGPSKQTSKRKLYRKRNPRRRDDKQPGSSQKRRKLIHSPPPTHQANEFSIAHGRIVQQRRSRQAVSGVTASRRSGEEYTDASFRSAASNAGRHAGAQPAEDPAYDILQPSRSLRGSTADRSIVVRAPTYTRTCTQTSILPS